MHSLTPNSVKEAYERIKPYINDTPVLSSGLLNSFLGHELYFKTEGLQKVGAFKARGALNAILKLKEQGQLPKHIVAFSSGNHSQAVAYAAKTVGVKATICMAKFTSSIKIQATKAYGAEVLLFETRQQAEAKVQEYINSGSGFIHPYDNPNVIAGQGTACYEVLDSGLKPDAIFATCGGGGWLSGSYLAKELLLPTSKIFGAEPLMANDAATSLKEGKIHKLTETPPTIADGAKTLAIAERTFAYLKKLDGFFEVPEEQIIYWTQWLMHLLKSTIEPTSATAMAAAAKWLSTQQKPQKVLILLSGGNISPQTYRNIWAENHLEKLPSL